MTIFKLSWGRGATTRWWCYFNFIIYWQRAKPHGGGWWENCHASVGLTLFPPHLIIQLGPVHLEWMGPKDNRPIWVRRPGWKSDYQRKEQSRD